MFRLALISFTAAALLPAAAIAQNYNAEVRFDDLDLSKPAGIKTLERRVAFVTRRICRSNNETGTRIIDMREEQQCRESVRKQVQERLAGQGVRLALN